MPPPKLTDFFVRGATKSFFLKKHILVPRIFNRSRKKKSLFYFHIVALAQEAIYGKMHAYDTCSGNRRASASPQGDFLLRKTTRESE